MSWDGDTGIYMEPVVPQIAVARPPDWVQCAREIYNLPADWESARISAQGDKRETGWAEINGAVYETVKTGPRKGKPNYKKPKPGTSQTLVIATVQYDAWLSSWERETGLCRKCRGTGWDFIGWNKYKGCRYVPCKACDATGAQCRGLDAA